MASIITFGCRLNSFESELIKEKARSANLDEETFILNTCSVTKEAEKEAIKKIKKIKKENPSAKIFVTGCAAQINPEIFAKMDEVELVFGNKEKLTETPYNVIKNKESFTPVKEELNALRREDKIFFNERSSFHLPSNKVLVNDIMSVKESPFNGAVLDFEGKTRAFLEIQNGCNHRCTFCIIPFARGNSRSVPFGILATEVQKLVEKGYKEVVLTGVDITDYGKDITGGLTLGKMVKRLLKFVPNLPRLRLSSIDVAEVDSDIYDLIQHEPRFMPYFHISLQSGDDIILKRMARRHTRTDVLNFVDKVRKLRKDAAFGADIISGFPTETEAQFQNSKNLIKEAGLSFCHVFSFSPHEGTPAAKMPQVEKKIIKERTKELINEGKLQLLKLLNSMIGEELNVLCEAGGNARCENFAPGIIKEKENAERGLMQKVIATGIDDEKLLFNKL